MKTSENQEQDPVSDDIEEQESYSDDDIEEKEIWSIKPKIAKINTTPIGSGPVINPLRPDIPLVEPITRVKT